MVFLAGNGTARDQIIFDLYVMHQNESSHVPVSPTFTLFNKQYFFNNFIKKKPYALHPYYPQK
jgi:hypothetical protein